MAAADRLETILHRANGGSGLSAADIAYLLRLEHRDDLEKLFSCSRKLRQRFFKNTVFLYGFVNAGTYCRNDCTFCFFRRSNQIPLRYRKTAEEIIEVSRQLGESGVHLIDLTMGEDPDFSGGDQRGFDHLAELVRGVKAATGLPVMVSPGVIPDSTLTELARAGASWYACYQETHNKALFERLRIGQPFRVRLAKKKQAHALGLLIEEGIMCGIGETDEDIARSMAAIGTLDADQVRVMNFVPQEGTPLAHRRPSDSARECLIIAIMRLVFPDRLIPASLDVDGLAGLRDRLDAGANVVTSLVPPGQGLAGVARKSLDIENARRTVDSVGPILDECGLKPADLDQYLHWIGSRRLSVLQRAGRVKTA